MRKPEQPDDFPRLTKPEATILRLVLDGHRYGLDLVKASDGELTRGGIYVQLERMTSKGYVTSKAIDAPSGEHGPARRIYSITGLGQRALCVHDAAREAYSKALRTT